MNGVCSKRVAGILFDLEGVLVFGKNLERLPAAMESLDLCRAYGLPFSIVTNTTTQTPTTLFQSLQERGFRFDERQLQTPLNLLSARLREFRRCLVLGNERLQSFVSEHGVQVTETPDVDLVLCGGGRKMEDLPLTLAAEAIIEHGAALVTLHRNRLFTNQQGKRQLDVGAVVAALEYSSGRTAENLGKPSEAYFRAATQKWGVPNERLLMVSDDPFTDLEGAKAMGIQTAFVLTGKYQREVLSQLAAIPDFIMQDLFELRSIVAAGEQPRGGTA